MRRAVTPARPLRLSARPRRGGTTLTEVLMSLLVMGIGLVSVATLFPLSVLRSVEATQQTTATSLRYTSEALVDGSYSDPVSDAFDEDGDTIVIEPRYNRRPGMPMAPSPSTFLVGSRTAGIALDPDGDRDPLINDTDYDASSHMYGYVETNHREGFYVVDPLGYWRMRQQAAPHATGGGVYGAQFFGDWSGVGGPPTFGTGASSTVWNINRFSLNVPDHSADPPAAPYAYMKPIYGFTGTPESFGSPPDAPADTPAELAEVEENAKRAELSVGLPDSFVTAADGRQSEGVAVTTTSVDFGGSSGGFDFSMFLVSAGVPDWVMIARGQVTLVSPDGRRSIVRELQDDPAVWTNAASEIQAGRLLFKQPLPASFTPADVDRVIVEAAEDRYSWMLTVRNRSDKGVRQALIDVVVFFRRAFGRQDERVYFVAQSFSSVQAFNRRKKELKEYFVAFNQAADPRPEIDEGDWMFDPVNFRWHKIGQVLEEGALTAAEITALSVPAGVPAPDTKITFRLEGADVAGEVIERGIFMQGVVDVYPIEPKASE